MIRSKLFTVLAVVLFFFGVATIEYAVAGEKTKWHGYSFGVKFEQVEVGDKEGHVIGVTKNKQIYVNETTGERFSSVSMGLMDLNSKTGEWSGHGYGVSYYKDGSKSFRTWEGKSVKPGYSEGVWTAYKGTGKWEGIKGGGTWKMYYVAPQQSYLEVEGEIEAPGQ